MAYEPDFKKWGTPQFNAGVDYALTIRSLMKAAHEYMVATDYLTVFKVLEQLEIELIPRMQKDQYDKSQKVKKNCMFFFIHLEYQSDLRFRLSLSRWFAVLNAIAHELGVIMPDKGSVYDNIDIT